MLIGDRALNRATLARQLLLHRSDLTVTAAVSHLGGLQAQTPHTWYVGLWSRLANYTPEATATLLQDRALVRLALMRATIHLVTGDDARWLRPVVQPVIERGTRSAFGRHWVGLDLAELVAAAQALLADEPLTFAELGRRLTDRWPDRDAPALAQAVRAFLPLVQVPPRGMWGRSGPVAHTTLDAWLGPAGPDEPGPAGPAALESIVLRYLAGFGPATVRDVQQWCGLTRLSEVCERLRPGLVVLRDEQGRELFDLPEAPRPDPDVPAPVRFLYDYDNLLLSHADRSRVVVGVDYAGQGFGKTSEAPSSVLVDGKVSATWKVLRNGRAATLRIRPFRRLTAAERDDLMAEGAHLLRFLVDPVTAQDVVIEALPAG